MTAIQNGTSSSFSGRRPCPGTHRPSIWLSQMWQTDRGRGAVSAVSFESSLQRDRKLFLGPAARPPSRQPSRQELRGRSSHAKRCYVNNSWLSRHRHVSRKGLSPRYKTTDGAHNPKLATSCTLCRLRGGRERWTRPCVYPCNMMCKGIVVHTPVCLQPYEDSHSLHLGS